MTNKNNTIQKNNSDIFFTLGALKNKIKDKINQVKVEEENRYLKDIQQRVDENLSITDNIKVSNENTTVTEPVSAPKQDNSVKGQEVAEHIASHNKILTKEKIRSLKSELVKNVFGQDSVVEEVVDVLKVAALNIRINKDKPAGNYLFAGPSGVGKTELAQTLAKVLEAPLLIINMGEYGLEQDVTKLIGTSPGYVGYHEGGILTNFVMNNQNSIILFDEIEKAHPAADKILLSIMDKGVATDNKGNNVIFKNTIIISTTNLGSDVEYVSDISEEDKMEYKMEAIKSGIRPEIINRYDSIFQFSRLSPEVYGLVVDKFLSGLILAMKEEHNISLKVTDKLRKYIVDRSYDPSMGGRPARRFIEKIIVKKLADYMLEDHGEELSLKQPALTLDLNKDNNVVFRGKSNKILGVLENTEELVKKIESTKFTK